MDAPRSQPDRAPVAGGDADGPAASRRAAFDVAVWRVVAAYRVVAAAWMATLAAFAVAGDQAPAAAAVPVVAGVAVWTVVAVAVTRRSQDRARWVFVAVDVVVAAAAVLVPVLTAPETGGYAGGYPFAAVLHAAVARGLAGALTAGVVLAGATAGQQIAAPTDLLAQPVVEVALFYLVSATVIAWGYGELYARERDRAAAQEALAVERAERARSDERAETAAALHDSVLQTLALIQRRTDDAEIRRLARSQERGLRDWLHGQRTSPGQPTADTTTVATALRARAAAIEADVDVVVDLVAVGDGTLDDDRRALVEAAAEAMLNAACHAGVDRVDVYCEADEARVFVTVRDRGRGFDPDAVPADRRGLRESIVGRLRRHGGTARLDAVPGRGTEVSLTLPAEGEEARP